MRKSNTYFLVLDIETSTLTEIDSNGVDVPVSVWLAYGVCKLYHINGTTTETLRFREWCELNHFFIEIGQRFENYQLLCYVHNLAYEFDYMIKNLSKSCNILSNSSRNLISCEFENYPWLQFRCSYQLTGHSLRKVGEELGFPKLESDYRFILPEDEVTEKEWEYCERDCDVVAMHIVKVEIPQYKMLMHIPLTKTGRVRKTLKKYYKQLEDSPKWDLLPPENCYQAMLDAFNGGVVCSSMLFTDVILHDVHSYDITSSYPYALISEMFPYTIRKVERVFDDIIHYHKFWIAKVKYNNIHSKYPWQWLSISKMNEFTDDCEFFNGKLVCGTSITRTITNVDFELVDLTYTYDSYEIVEFYELENYDYIPAPYLETIKVYSQRKYELKNKLKSMKETDPDYTEVNREYLLSKNDFNSIYGMTVQKLVQPTFTVDENFMWHECDNEYHYIEGKHIGRNFLFGIYVTAYARANLIKAIVANCPYNFVYCDTDSIKFIGENRFVDTNKPLKDEFLAIPSLAKLGRFDYEETYHTFKTLGAKKYAYTYESRVFLTIAGLPKSKDETTDYIKDIHDFVPGIVFDNCKLGKKYINNDYTYDINDNDVIVNLEYRNDVQEYIEENGIHTAGGVGLYPTSYKLDVTPIDMAQIEDARKHRDEYLDFIYEQTGQKLNKFIEV